MARSRNIKPGFFKNEDLAECSAWARLCFAGLWILADREGRLVDRPKRIKAELFAYDSVEVGELLDELARHGFILRFQPPEGPGVIEILQFGKHQNPHFKEPASELPSAESLGLLGHSMAPKPRKASANASLGSKGGEAAESTGLSTQHDPPEAPDEPEASPGLEPHSKAIERGVNRADSGFLIPDSLIPDPLTREPEASGSGPPAAEPTGTPAGAICRALRRAGIQSVNPSNVTLLGLLQAGATEAEFLDAVPLATGKRDPFAYLLSIVDGHRREVAQVAAGLHHGPLPGTPEARPWYATAGGVKAMGERVGVPYTDQDECAPFPVYKARVVRAAKQAGVAA